MTYGPPNQDGAIVKFRSRYENYIGGEWVEPVKGQYFAVAEAWENGKAVRETLAADLQLTVDHFRYFAGCIRAQEGGLSQLADNTVTYHFNEPLGVVGQINPWNFRCSWRRGSSRLRSPPETAGPEAGRANAGVDHDARRSHR